MRSLARSHLQDDPHELLVSAGGLVNGSRGVIVDWVDRELVPLDEGGQGSGQRNGAGRGGGGFGGEEWRAQAASLWADQQKDEIFPIVYFATGRQGASASLLAHLRS